MLPAQKKQWKNTVFRNFPIIFAHLTLSSFFYSSLFCFSSLHIVGSLTVKLPSNMYTDSYIKCLAREAKCRKGMEWVGSSSIGTDRFFVFDYIWKTAVNCFSATFCECVCTQIDFDAGGDTSEDTKSVKTRWSSLLEMHDGFNMSGVFRCVLHCTALAKFCTMQSWSQ